MDIILLQDVEKVGEKYNIVSVKNGFGRNYLIPRRMAVIANPTNLAKLEEIKRREEQEMANLLTEFTDIAGRLEGKVLSIGAKAGTSGKIFGSVTNIQIAQALKEQFNIEVDRRIIEIPEEVKVLGTYTAILNLHAEVNPKVSFDVVAE